MKTKTFFLSAPMFVFLVICSTGIQAQTPKSNLDQLKLNQQLLGTWEATYNKDTLEVWEVKQYGKSYINNVSLVIMGTKSPFYVANSCFDSKEGNFKGFSLYASGSYATWISIWTTEKKLSFEVSQNFKPETLLRKSELVYETPTSFMFIRFNTSGINTYEHKFNKVK